MKIVIVFVIIILIILFYFHCKLKTIESFLDVIGDNGILPTNYVDSIPVHTKIQDRYKNMYYYEYPDDEYQDILISILSVPIPSTINIKSSDDFINYISIMLNKSQKLNDIQIVDQSINNDSIELLLYRKNKYQGKHVKFTIDKNWNILSIRVIGSVPEDQIALFPVYPFNPSDSESLMITNNFEDSAYTFLNKDDYLIDNIPTNEIIVFDNDKKKNILNNSRLFNKDTENTNLFYESVTPGMSPDSMNAKYKDKTDSNCLELTGTD